MAFLPCFRKASHYSAIGARPGSTVHPDALGNRSSDLNYVSQELFTRVHPEANLFEVGVNLLPVSLKLEGAHVLGL